MSCSDVNRALILLNATHGFSRCDVIAALQSASGDLDSALEKLLTDLNASIVAELEDDAASANADPDRPSYGPEECAEMQEDELVALEAIYGEEFECVSPRRYRIKLMCKSEVGAATSPWTLVFLASSLYPVEPPLVMLASDMFESATNLQLTRALAAHAIALTQSDNDFSPKLFELCSWVTEDMLPGELAACLPTPPAAAAEAPTEPPHDDGAPVPTKLSSRFHYMVCYKRDGSTSRVDSVSVCSLMRSLRCPKDTEGAVVDFELGEKVEARFSESEHFERAVVVERKLVDGEIVERLPTVESSSSKVSAAQQRERLQRKGKSEFQATTLELYANRDRN